jgi:hypothetical protein
MRIEAYRHEEGAWRGTAFRDDESSIERCYSFMDTVVERQNSVWAANVAKNPLIIEPS